MIQDNIIINEGLNGDGGVVVDSDGVVDVDGGDDKRNIHNQVPDFELCIPHVNNYHNRYEFIELFKKLKWGSINDVRFYYKKNSNFKTVVISFHKWYDDDNNEVSKIKRALYTGNSYKLMYNLPNYWKCYKNKF